MYKVQFAPLNYYPSFISDECITVGVLFHNLDTNERQFEITTNWERVASFDDELNIDFMKDYLLGIREEVSNDLINRNELFKMKEFTRFYVNEYKFSSIQSYLTDNKEEFIERTKKVFLKFDYNKRERLNENEEKKYIRQLLKSNEIEYSCKKIPGYYDDSIKYDYIIDNYGIKLFTFEGKSLSHVISSVKIWAFNAFTLKDRINSVFIYDVERTDSEYYDTIMSILKDHAYKVLSLQEGFDFILSLNRNLSIF